MMVEKPFYSTGMFEAQRAETQDTHTDSPTSVVSTMPVINTGTDTDLPTECCGCHGRIMDRYYLLAADRQWHVHCLMCCECNISLDSELTCYSKGGKIYCKEDYYRLFATNRCCARCQMGISASELVMKAKDCVFHINCFTCATCNKALTTGDQFGMRDNVIYCRTHYELMIHGDYLPLSPTIPGLSPTHGMPFYNGVGAVQKGRPRKRKNSSMSDPDLCHSLGIGSGSNTDSDQLDGYGQTARQKRMRTSFKHHQLRTMKSYFALNHNPDAKDLKQLAQKTGLTKRVLQVWFQNARAKYRRNLLKQESGGSTGVGQDGGDSQKSPDTPTLTEMSNSRSPALSDISSSASLQDSSVEGDHNGNTATSLTELFSNSISNIS